MKRLMVAAALMMSCTGFAPPFNAGTPYEFTPTPVGGAYPACSGDESEDRCIQLYERGVNTAANLAENAQGGRVSQYAMAEPAYDEDYAAVGGAYEAAEPGMGDDWAENDWAYAETDPGYPPCYGDEDGDRCIQGSEEDMGQSAW